MLSLREAQQHFKNFILKNENNLEDSTRLQIYRNNVFITLIEVLQDLYPTVQRLVGEKFFVATAREYVIQYSSLSGDLHDYGGYFAKFLAQFSRTQTLPYLSEMAQLEWAYHQVFHEADCKPFDFQKLKAVDEASYCSIKFKLNPAARLFAFQFPILQIWKICYAEDQQVEKINLAEQGENILVIRRNNEIVFEEMTSGEFALLSALARSDSFEKACEFALKIEENIDINYCLRQHLLRGMLVDFYF